MSSYPYFTATADFNGDGKVDLATANANSNLARIFLGNGNGTFQAGGQYGTGASPYWVAVADLNGDGVNDLVTADAFGGVSVLLSNGTATAATAMTSSALRPITGVSLATRADALAAQGQIDGYLEPVNQAAGIIGTALSRFRIAAHIASSIAEVSTAAESRITDADTAENSAALVRHEILQQASTAVLAQANQQPALALTLLHE